MTSIDSITNTNTIFSTLDLQAGVFEVAFPENFESWTTEEAKKFVSEATVKYADVALWTPFRRDLMLALSAHYFAGLAASEISVDYRTKLLSISLFLEGRNLRSFNGVVQKPSDVPCALISMAAASDGVATTTTVGDANFSGWGVVFASHTALVGDSELGIPDMLKNMPQENSGDGNDDTGKRSFSDYNEVIFLWAKATLVDAVAKSRVVEALRNHFVMIKRFIEGGCLGREGWDEFGERVRKMVLLWNALERVQISSRLQREEGVMTQIINAEAKEYGDIFNVIANASGNQIAQGFEDLKKVHRERCAKAPIAVAIYMSSFTA